jgi:hypothetical protein
MSEYTRIETTPEVAAVLRASHRNMAVFESFSDPSGTEFGGSGEVGRMETAFGFPGTDYPLLYCRTTWLIGIDAPGKRSEEKHEYWLCIAKQEAA